MIQNEMCKIKLKDNICFVNYLKADYNLNEADEMVKQRLSVTKDGNYPMIQDIRKVKNFSIEVRHRFAEKDSKYGVSACAIIMNSKIQVVISRFYLAFAKLDIPTKFFNSPEKGLEWLQQFKTTK